VSAVSLNIKPQIKSAALRSFDQAFNRQRLARLDYQRGLAVSFNRHG
jgi:hypothetical protein